MLRTIIRWSIIMRLLNLLLVYQLLVLLYLLLIWLHNMPITLMEWWYGSLLIWKLMLYSLIIVILLCIHVLIWRMVNGSVSYWSSIGHMRWFGNLEHLLLLNMSILYIFLQVRLLMRLLIKLLINLRRSLLLCLWLHLNITLLGRRSSPASWRVWLSLVNLGVLMEFYWLCSSLLD